MGSLQIQQRWETPEMRDKGKLVSWNDEKGFGFIAPFSGATQVFIHVKAFSNRNRRPEINDVVTYTLSSDKQGRPRAINATLAGTKPPTRTERRSGAAGMLIAAMFLGAVGASVLLANLQPAIFVLYLAASLVTFVAYAIDKSAAQKGRWRTSEATLHVLALAGGWPGALVAQTVLRHKSRKQPFRSVFWATVLLNCAALAWLLTPDGRSTVATLLGASTGGV
jgi:uncharacterized membrane protein YsdA (DUF1294 family)/cold shock CspA family protein